VGILEYQQYFGNTGILAVFRASDDCIVRSHSHLAKLVRCQVGFLFEFPTLANQVKRELPRMEQGQLCTKPSWLTAPFLSEN